MEPDSPIPPTPTGRLLGVDYGSKRIGLAISDPSQSICSPAEVISSTGDLRQDAIRLLRWAEKEGTTGIVLGLPLNMDGTDSTQTKRIRSLHSALSVLTSLPVSLHDERLTTFAADDEMKSAELSRKRRNALRDAIAAKLILESFLATHRANPYHVRSPEAEQ